MKKKPFFTIAAIIFLLMATYFTMQMRGSGSKTCSVSFEQLCYADAFGVCRGTPWGYYMIIGICDHTTCITVWKLYCEDDYGIVSYYLTCEGNSSNCTQW